MKHVKRTAISVLAGGIVLVNLMLVAELQPQVVGANIALLGIAVVLLYERGVYRRWEAVAKMRRRGFSYAADICAADPWWLYAGEWVLEVRDRIEREWER